MSTPDHRSGPHILRAVLRSARGRSTGSACHRAGTPASGESSRPAARPAAWPVPPRRPPAICASVRTRSGALRTRSRQWRSTSPRVRPARRRAAPVRHRRVTPSSACRGRNRPSDRASGDQNGCFAPSVPASCRASSWCSDRTNSFEGPPATARAVNAMSCPSGETVGGESRPRPSGSAQVNRVVRLAG